ARFEKEARMMARLEHQNLVPIFAVDRAEDVPYIVMKLLEGKTLSQTKRARGRPYEPMEVTPLLEQLAHGLGHIHERGVVHRDIKPGNLFLAPDGHLTILALGVARDGLGHLTTPGTQLGTPQYMSPEQAVTAGLDARSDIYSVGVILFELV